MQRITTKLTQRGQVTVPVAVQRTLGVGPRDSVSFLIEDGGVRMVPAPRTLEELSGTVGPPTRTEDLLKLIEDAKLDRADQTGEKFRRS